MSEPTIEVQGAALAYRLAHQRVGSFKEFVIRMVRRQVEYERLWALQDVSFEVHPGETLAVVGHNGAGKSTLMKILARVLPPTQGRVIVRGAVAPMIELGAGFNVEMTAYENIVLYGTLLGRDPRDMRLRAREIAEWAGLVDYLDVPVRSFSTGMLARLGFSVATDAQTPVLVVDEVLSVGDEAFQVKSRGRINDRVQAGAAVVLVSHDLDTVLQIADRVLWLQHGRMALLGEPKEVIEAYRTAADGTVGGAR